MVRWHKSAEAFTPEQALTALAETLGYQAKSRSGKKSARITLTIDTPVSAMNVKRRKARLVTPEAAKALTKLVYAATHDPERAPLIDALAARLKAGEDVAAELVNLVSPAPRRPRRAADSH
jgi:hypothetical protein